MRRFIIIALSVCCLFLSDSPVPKSRPALPPSGPVAGDCRGMAADVAAVTYNAGLAPGMVPFAAPRTRPLAEAVGRATFDILCLQEVWTADGQRAVIDSLRLPPEQVLAFDTTDLAESGDARCDEGELSPLIACAGRECGADATEDQTLCALHHCQRELLLLYLRDPRCLQCLTSHVGEDVRGIGRSCVGASASHVYGGRNGVILASRWRLYDKEVMLLPASDANRAALFARVEVPGRGPMQVACTHLSAPQRVSPSYPGFDDWEDEQIAQTRLIAARLRGRAAGAPSLFLGDMNFGPGLSEAVQGNSPRAWDEAVRLGFISPAAAADPPFCSICPEDTLRGGYAGHLIDHALALDPPGGATIVPRCADRLFTAPATVTGYRGEPVRTHLSDHYGVRVMFDIR
jgi:endonuclease/exonuclease/phosphatase family metal-dependent hydrolase